MTWEVDLVPRVMHRCPRCFANADDRDIEESIYCRHCGTAMHDRYCLPCQQPVFGPEMLHIASVMAGGPKVL